MLSQCTGVSEDSVMNLNRSKVRIKLSENMVPTLRSVFQATSCLHLFRFSVYQFVRSYWLAWRSDIIKKWHTDPWFWSTPYQAVLIPPILPSSLRMFPFTTKINAVVCPWALKVIKCLTFVEMLLITESWFFFLLVFKGFKNSVTWCYWSPAIFSGFDIKDAWFSFLVISPCPQSF